MRLLVICFVLAFVLLLPALADLRQFELPYRGLIAMPAVALDFPVIILHEMGHTVSRWLFGYLALPDFDFENGGGMKVNFKQSNILLGLVYAGLFLGFFLIIAKRHYKIAGGMAVGGGLHLALMFGQGHQVFIAYMGHGCELLVAAFLIVRAARGEAVGGWVRQYLTMILGLYLMGKNVILALGLGIGSPQMREAYAHLKGVHVAHDFSLIAKLTEGTMQQVAFYSLGLTLACAAYVVFLAVWVPAHERLSGI